MSNEVKGNALPHKYNECYQCQKRQVGCHSHCAAYLAFRDQTLEAAKRREKEHREIEDHVAVFANRRKDNERAIWRKRR